MYYPLTPVFCTPKYDAEKKFWTARFRQAFGNITPNQFKRNEARLEKRCKKYSVDYVAPQLTDSVEATYERKACLQKKCKAAADKIRRRSPSVQEKERVRGKSRNRKGSGPIVDTNSSEIRHFRITGRGGTPNYSYLPVTPFSTCCLIGEEECSSARSHLEQLTLGGQEQVEFEKPLCFWSRYEKVCVKKRKKVFMDGWNVMMCDTKDVLSAEIYINDNCTKTGANVGCRPSAGFFSQVKNCNHVSLYQGGNNNGVLVMFLHIYDGDSSFFLGDSEGITVNVVADIPSGREDIIQEAKRMVEAEQEWKWNGKELYDYLHNEGITQVRFEGIDFNLSIVRAGSIAHRIVQRQILELDYKAGRSNEKPPALTQPLPKDPSKAESNVYHPLTPIFCIPRDSAEESEWEARFLQSFHVTAVRFRLNERKLADRCKEHSVTYVAPQLEDTVDQTLRRKYNLNKKIQLAIKREDPWR